ncbi:MAG TPA: hypothetical protein VLK58_01280 [Conexibacter sp.]|nr:hypothetical protein [Conexibacter sp.]
MRTTRLTTICAVAAAFAIPSTAAADSIVYVDGGNVFSAAPDGSHRVQLTDGGDWHSPTQSDDGTIAAVQGSGPIVVMAHDGRPLRTITTQPAPTANGGTFMAKPVDLSFSPDGSKIAYGYVGVTCPPGSSCGSYQRSVFYTRADVTEATPQAVWGNEYGAENPEWITNDRALVHGGAGSQVAIDELSGGEYSRIPWLTPEVDLGDSELSRDGRRLAMTYDYGDATRVVFMATKGDPRTELPPQQPDLACQTDSGDARHGDPSWSPDGSGIAFESSSGIQVFRFSEMRAGSCSVSGDSLLTPTGQNPDWGPADPPAARWVAPVAPAPGGGPTPAPAPRAPGATVGSRAPGAGSGAGAGAGRGAPAVSFTVSAVTRATLRRGLTVKVTAPAAGRVTVKLTAAGKPLAAGSARAKRAGTVAVRLSKVAARKASAAKKVTFTVTAGGRTSARTVTLR